MPKGTNQKFKLYRLAQVMLKETDEDHFITVKKTRKLIGKLEKMVSRYEASELQRQVFVAKRIKTMNESVYYTVDVIHRAIAENRKIEFQYFQWNVKKEMDLRHGGAWYRVSPWGLSWDDENYYLVAYDAGEEKIKHYRVDKMRGLRMLEEPREGEEHFRQFDMGDYARKNFGMFGGREYRVRLLMKNDLAGVVIDRFGKDVSLVPVDEEHFAVNVDVYLSSQFLHWIFALGDGAKIVGPPEVVEEAKKEIRRLAEQYR